VKAVKAGSVFAIFGLLLGGYMRYAIVSIEIIRMKVERATVHLRGLFRFLDACTFLVRFMTLL